MVETLQTQESITFDANKRTQIECYSNEYADELRAEIIAREGVVFVNRDQLGRPRIVEIEA